MATKNRWKHRELPLGMVPIFPGATIGHVVDPDSGCWIWTGALDRGGYGTVRDPETGKNTTAHALMHRRECGPIEHGWQLDHLCRRRSCINPRHLEPVPGPVNVQRGLLAKMTPDRVREIRVRFSDGLRLRDLADEFGLGVSSVHAIVHRHTWKNVA